MKTQEIRRANLAQLVEINSLSSVALSVKKPASQINDMIAGRKSFGEKVARQIEPLLGKPAGWLDKDHGKQLADVSVSENNQIVIHSEKRQESNLSAGPDIRGMIPLISTVKAGNATEVIDIYAPGYADEWIPSPVKVREHTFALRVEGDSMEPRYPAGYILVVEPDADPTVGQFVIAKNSDGEALFKKWVRDGGRDYLKSLNPSYPLIPMDDYHIIGVVVFAGEFMI